MSLAKIIAIFLSAFLLELPNQEPTDSPDWIHQILDIWVWVSFTSIGVLLLKAFLILTVCLLVRNG